MFTSFLSLALGPIGIVSKGLERQITKGKKSSGMRKAVKYIAGGKEKEAGQNNIPSSNSPSQVIVSQQSHFMNLYKLLEHPSESVASEAWELLSVIPLNEVLLKEFQDFEKTEGWDWKNYLSESSLY